MIEPQTNKWITVRAPGRVNLIGDHTDYTGGLAFPIAIDRWTEIIGHRTGSVRFISDHADQIVEFATNTRPNLTRWSGWGRFVAAVAAEIWDENPSHLRGFTGQVRTTLPIGAGLSSSASLEIALAMTLGYRGDQRGLAELGRRAEHNATGVPSGIMDQLCIAAARDQHGMRLDCQTLEIDHVPIPPDIAIEVHHVAARTLEGSEYATRVAECQRAEREIGPLRCATTAATRSIRNATLRRRAQHVITENQRVEAFVEALSAGDYRLAGDVMLESHHSLKDNYEVSTAALDEMVDKAKADSDVYGARMTGGGFGGCIVTLRRKGTAGLGWSVRPVGGASIRYGH